MQPEPKRSSEFRRYRQVLTGIYVGTAAAGFLLLAASVARELLFRTPAIAVPASALQAENPDPALLLECNRLVSSQLRSLGTTTCKLFTKPLLGEEVDVDSEWSEFSREWRDQWDVIDAQCRFKELAGTRMGDAYDRMAQVHSGLLEMKLKYQELLVRFDKEQAVELAEMRRALDQSAEALSNQFGRPSPRPEAPTP